MTALKAVVFDMDDTLLSINLNAFIGMFALDEANLLAQAARKSYRGALHLGGKCNVGAQQRRARRGRHTDEPAVSRR